MTHSLPVIFGIAGTEVTPAERAMFAQHPVLGVILFARNIVSLAQVQSLCAEIKSILGPQAIIAIDQEGGRVARLKPPLWPEYPTARSFLPLYRQNPDAARAAVLANYQNIGGGLAELGITMNCAPVLDVPIAGAHDVIGDRAFAADAAIVADLATAACAGLRAAKIDPVIKHIPGHGRAMVDSHHDLPVVDTNYQTLCRTDFVPFRALRGEAYAMTAHVVYTAIDPVHPITLSKTGIAKVIRGEIGFGGKIMSDDLGMKALKGNLGALSHQSLAAGCDIILHCSGVLAEMQEIATAVREYREQHGI